MHTEQYPSLPTAAAGADPKKGSHQAARSTAMQSPPGCWLLGCHGRTPARKPGYMELPPLRQTPLSSSNSVLSCPVNNPISPWWIQLMALNSPGRGGCSLLFSRKIKQPPSLLLCLLGKLSHFCTKHRPVCFPFHVYCYMMEQLAQVGTHDKLNPWASVAGSNLQKYVASLSSPNWHLPLICTLWLCRSLGMWFLVLGTSLTALENPSFWQYIVIPKSS